MSDEDYEQERASSLPGDELSAAKNTMPGDPMLDASGEDESSDTAEERDE
jgi:hypothetical protein